MALYEKRLQEDIERIMGEVRTMGEMAERVVQNAVHALLSSNPSLANDTVLADHPINRKMREIDRLSHAFIACHLPSAGHLRLISSVIRINIALERIGDYAVTISRESLQLPEGLQNSARQEVEGIANSARSMLHDALSAFYAGDAEMARTTQRTSATLESTLNGIYTQLADGRLTETPLQMFALFATLNQLKRVADQAKNICEDTLFSVTGETKAKKVYNLLFVDDTDHCMTRMATAIAAKNHPNSGRYHSAGSAPATAIDPLMVAFMEQKGVAVEPAPPQPLEQSPEELAEYHVVISLQGEAQSYLPKVPFHTAFLEWDLGQPPAGEDPQRYAEIYRELSIRIGELMVLLRGEGAD